MRLHPAWIASTAALYAVAGEIAYRAGRPVVDAAGACRPGSADPTLPMLALTGVVYVVSAAWIARRGGPSWALATAVHAGIALALGFLLGGAVYQARTAAGPRCAEMRFCGLSCYELPWWAQVLALLVPVLAAAAFAPVIGWAARKMFRPPVSPAR